MPQPVLPFRLTLHPDALARASAAHGKRTRDGELRLVKSTLLGHERRDTSKNIADGKTAASPEALASAAMRYQQAEHCNLIVAVAGMIAIQNTATGEIITLDAALDELRESTAGCACDEDTALTP